MKAISRLLAASALASFAGFAHAAEAPKVLASFKPIHSLVAGVMQGVGEPGLVIDTNASPHSYTMKPSDAAKLDKANVVFWIGPGFEAFLEKPLETLGEKAVSVELSEAPGITLLDPRTGSTFEKHSHAHEEGADHGDDHDHDAKAEDAGHDHDDHDDHDHDEEHKDMHIWLDPANARAMVKQIVATLSKVDPANAAAYEKNGAAEEARLEALDKELVTTLASTKDRTFIVFHDAYQYLQKRYDLNIAGSITLSPETPPSAARIREIHAKIADLGATCVFSEPPFEPKIVTTLVEGTKAKAGTLNPEGGAMKPGADLYFDLMRENAASLVSCLDAK